MLIPLLRIANLYLPGLNADIIDKGTVERDTGFIVRTGTMMLAITVVPVVA